MIMYLEDKVAGCGMLVRCFTMLMLRRSSLLVPYCMQFVFVATSSETTTICTMSTRLFTFGVRLRDGVFSSKDKYARCMLCESFFLFLFLLMAIFMLHDKFWRMLFGILLLLAAMIYAEKATQKANHGADFRTTSKNILFSSMGSGSSHNSWVIRILDQLHNRGHNVFFATTVSVQYLQMQK